jgi:hypothetical protein
MMTPFGPSRASGARVVCRADHDSPLRESGDTYDRGKSSPLNPPVSMRRSYRIGRRICPNRGKFLSPAQEK